MSSLTTDAAAPSPLRIATAQGTERSNPAKRGESAWGASRGGRPLERDCWHLGDKVLCGGDIVELCCSGGWLTGRFETGPDGEPTFWFSVERGGGKVAQQTLRLPDGALLRWP